MNIGLNQLDTNCHKLATPKETNTGPIKQTLWPSLTPLPVHLLGARTQLGSAALPSPSPWSANDIEQSRHWLGDDAQDPSIQVVECVNTERLNGGANVWVHTKDSAHCIDLREMIGTFQLLLNTPLAKLQPSLICCLVDGRRARGTLTIKVSVLVSSINKTPEIVTATRRENVTFFSKALLPMDRKRSDIQQAYVNGSRLKAAADAANHQGPDGLTGLPAPGNNNAASDEPSLSSSSMSANQQAKTKGRHQGPPPQAPPLSPWKRGAGKHQQQQTASGRLLKQKKGAGPPPPPPCPPHIIKNKPGNKAPLAPPPPPPPRPTSGASSSPAQSCALPQKNGGDTQATLKPTPDAGKVCKSVHMEPSIRGAEMWLNIIGSECGNDVDRPKLFDRFQLAAPSAPPVAKQPGASSEGIRPPPSGKITFIESRRELDLSLILAVLRKGFSKTSTKDFHELVATMDLDHVVSEEEVNSLSKVLLPTDQERADLQAYLDGSHPKHMGERSLDDLAVIDKLFASVMTLPRLQPRLKALAFIKGFKDGIDKANDQLNNLHAAIKELRDSGDFAQLLGIVLRVVNALQEHNSSCTGQHRKQSSGFKLKGLLQLPRIKDKERENSLLDFVIQQLVQNTNSSPQALLEKQMLSTTRPVADLQVPAIKKLVASLGEGMAQVSKEIKHASAEGCNPPKATENVKKALAVFAAGAKEEMAALREKASQVDRDLKALADFYGEDYQEEAPTALISTAAEFSWVWEKALKAAAAAAAAAGCVALTEAESAPPGSQGRAAKED